MAPKRPPAASSDDLLVGNFGDGHINAYSPRTGRFVGELKNASGQPIAITHLWAIAFGNGGAAGPRNTLYFTAGLTSHLAKTDAPFHGVFGSLQVAPARRRGAMTVKGSASGPASIKSVEMAALPANSSGEPDQGIEALSPVSSAKTRRDQ